MAHHAADAGLASIDPSGQGKRPFFPEAKTGHGNGSSSADFRKPGGRRMATTHAV